MAINEKQLMAIVVLAAKQHFSAGQIATEIGVDFGEVKSVMNRLRVRKEGFFQVLRRAEKLKRNLQKEPVKWDKKK